MGEEKYKCDLYDCNKAGIYLIERHGGDNEYWIRACRNHLTDAVDKVAAINHYSVSVTRNKT